MLHVQNTEYLWGSQKGNAERRGFTSMDWSGWAEGKDVVHARKAMYRRELEQLMAEKNKEQQKDKERNHSDERKVK